MSVSYKTLSCLCRINKDDSTPFLSYFINAENSFFKVGIRSWLFLSELVHYGSAIKDWLRLSGFFGIFNEYLVEIRFGLS